MAIKIALAGNPNSGKTTLFNNLTGSSQYVGNWPGVTVEKKEGKLKGHKKEAIIVDLPGIYSLSPYSLEEVIARDFIIDEKPDAIINIVDASNLERNLYLTTQVVELGVPVVVALNMMDVVEKRGDKIDEATLSKRLGVPVIKISAVKKTGMKDLTEAALKAASQKEVIEPSGVFESEVESNLSKIEDILEQSGCPKLQKRWFAIKYFEADDKAMAKLPIPDQAKQKIADISKQCEKDLDDEAQSIITGERYTYVGKLIDGAYQKKQERKLTVSDKIDKVVTNKWLALPIFFLIMWLVYYVSISTVGDWCIGYVEELFGWIGGGVNSLLVSLGAADWTISLVVDGIIGSIGSIFTFVPQLMILFLFLALLESSGYMARVAFIMDRLFRKFGLSGKSFIPMLIGTGCSIPGVMASRTIENERDRRMTIMLTPFIPCGAKLPVFAMFIALIFPEETWVGPSMYLIGIVVAIISGLILKRTKSFKGDPAPFVMELPEYKVPRAKGVLLIVWERAKSFIKKAGTIIFIACTVIWILQNFSLSFEYLGGERVDESILAAIGGVVRYIFIPLGFGDSWAPAAAAFTGMVAKEVVVATFTSVGSVIPIAFTQVTAFAFMIFTLLAAPCFAAIGAIHREMGSWKWTLKAILYQTGVAYVLAMLVNLVGGLIFSNSAAVAPRVLDTALLEEASEGSVINGDIVLIVFGAILVLALIIGIVSRVRSSRQRVKTVGA